MLSLSHSLIPFTRIRLEARANESFDFKPKMMNSVVEGECECEVREGLQRVFISLRGRGSLNPALRQINIESRQKDSDDSSDRYVG